ncbi:hypothetical protein BC829DRAFT_417896 [Chytridium lagenaria]|nr:hypothetical protein BC829DRAFT_417896 [Chytridium lagenaria]
MAYNEHFRNGVSLTPREVTEARKRHLTELQALIKKGAYYGIDILVQALDPGDGSTSKVHILSNSPVARKVLSHIRKTVELEDTWDAESFLSRSVKLRRCSRLNIATRSANLKDNLVKKINEAYEKAGHRRRLEQLPKKDIVSGDAFFSHNMTPPVMLSFKRKRWSAVDLDVLEGHPFAFTIPVNAVIPATSEPLEADVGNEDGMEELDQLGEDS